MSYAFAFVYKAVRLLRNRQSVTALAVPMFLVVTGCLLGCGGGNGEGSDKGNPPSGLSYSQPAIAATMNKAISPDTPSVTGKVTSYSVSPALPAGLSLTSSTGMISGTPTALAAKASYTVTASNSSGSTTASIQVTVNPEPPTGLSYSQHSIAGFVNQAITPDTPTVTGTVNSYAVSPTLPAGLSLDSSSGVISGTPASTSQASYAVTASNAGGSTTTSIEITVAVAPPVGLAYPQTVITNFVGKEITPDNPGTTGTITSYTVSPALPPGLSLDPSTGVISGTPTAEAASATYVITGSNAAGSVTSSVSPTITITPAPIVLLQLDNQNGINTLQFANSSVLSQDSTGLWYLWNYATGAMIASGNPLLGQQNVTGFRQQTKMAGSTLAIGIPGGIQVRSSADGHILGTIVSPGFSLDPVAGLIENDSWQLASDGSFISLETPSGLFVYAPGGQLQFARNGAYFAPTGPNPFVFAAPGQVQVANGPAGQSTIETISVPSGAATVSSPYQGTFQTWFTDGGRFLTTQSGTAFIYSSSGVQENAVQLQQLSDGGYLVGAAGNWVVTNGQKLPMDTTYTLNIYQVGSSTPTMTVGDAGPVTLSGTTLALMTSDLKTLSEIDLSGEVPSKADYSGAILYLGPTSGGSSSTQLSFAAVSSTEWVAAYGTSGRFVDGATMSLVNPRFLGVGGLERIAGSAGRVAILTTGGSIFYFTPPDTTLEGQISPNLGEVELSTDGSVMAGESLAGSLVIYSLPSGTVSYTFPYSTTGVPPSSGTEVSDFSLSGSGTTLGQILVSFNGPNVTLSELVSPTSGSPTIWSGTGGIRSLLLSPDGTLFAVSSDRAPLVVTIYQDGGQIATVPGVALGWLDNGRLLVQNFGSNLTTYLGSTIYSPTGAALATPPLPILHGIQPVALDAVYAPELNAIYSLTTGQTTWTSPYPPDSTNGGPYNGIGAVAGPYVVFESGGQVIAVTY